MMAFCGLNCAECAAYKATMGHDVALLEETARLWTDSQNKYTPADVICLGCTEENSSLLYASCAGCATRACAMRKGIRYCATCDDFDNCSTVKDLMKTFRPNVLKVIGLMRERVKRAQGSDLPRKKRHRVTSGPVPNL